MELLKMMQSQLRYCSCLISDFRESSGELINSFLMFQAESFFQIDRIIHRTQVGRVISYASVVSSINFIT